MTTLVTIQVLPRVNARLRITGYRPEDLMQRLQVRRLRFTGDYWAVPARSVRDLAEELTAVGYDVVVERVA